MWESVLPVLERHLRVVRYDTRGHGAGPVPPGPYTLDDLAGDLLQVLDTVGAHRAHLVGLSLGGLTALRVAQRAPDRVERLVVLCTSARFAPAQQWVDRAATVRAGGAGAIARSVVGRWFTPGYFEGRPAERGYWESMVASIPAEGYAACCDALVDADVRAGLADVQAPTLAVAGEEDPSSPPAALAAIAEGVRHGRLLVVPGAAHLAVAQRPDVIGAAMVEHLVGADGVVEPVPVQGEA
jgi:3-oxoadipate enol-lactonase